MSVRRSVEKRSAPLLVRLTAAPKLVIPVVSLLLLIGGLALPVGAGVVCLAVLAAFIGWLTYLSWPAIVGPARAVRLVTLGLIIAVAISRLI